MRRSAMPPMPASSSRRRCASSSSGTACRNSRSSPIPGRRCRRGALLGGRRRVSGRWGRLRRFVRRPPRRYEKPPSAPAWRVVTLEDQWARFVEDVPRDRPPALSRAHFDEWGERYLDSDSESRGRQPAGVKIPTGPFVDILRAWHGELAYDPGRVQAPVAIIRGEWDGLIPDADAAWLFDAFKASPIKRDIKISRGTHLMHLEAMRYALYRESIAFLHGQDQAPLAQLEHRR